MADAGPRGGSGGCSRPAPRSRASPAPRRRPLPSRRLAATSFPDDRRRAGGRHVRRGATLAARLGVAGATCSSAARPPATPGSAPRRGRDDARGAPRTASPRARPPPIARSSLAMPGWPPASLRPPSPCGRAVRSSHRAVHRGEPLRLSVPSARAHPGAAVTLSSGRAAPGRSGAASRWMPNHARSSTWPTDRAPPGLPRRMAADEEHRRRLRRPHGIAAAEPLRRPVDAKAHHRRRHLAVPDVLLLVRPRGALVPLRAGAPVAAHAARVTSASTPEGMYPGGPYGARIMSYHSPCAIHGTNEPGCSALPAQLLARLHEALQRQRHLALRPRAIGTPVWNVP